MTRHVQLSSPMRRPAAHNPDLGVLYHSPPNFCQVLNRQRSTFVRFSRRQPSSGLEQLPKESSAETAVMFISPTAEELGVQR